MIANESPEFSYYAIAQIIYTLMMLVIIIFIMIQSYKMEKIHRRRMELLKELDEVIIAAQKHRDELIDEQNKMKKLYDDFKNATKGKSE